jgi:hypothetical protein
MDTNSFVGVQSLLSVGHRQQLLPPFGGGLGPAVVPWSNIHSTTTVATAASVTCHNNNAALNRSITSQTTAPSLHCQFTGDIMGMTSSIGAATSTAFSSSSSHNNNDVGGGRVHPNNATSGGGGWSSPELLTGTALLFAGAAAAASVGSIFLGPNVEDSGLRGTKKTNNVGGDKGGGGTNGNGGGSGGSNNNGSGGGAGGDKYQHSFDSSVREQDDKGDILELNEAAAPRAYEVSVSHRTKTVCVIFS